MATSRRGLTQRQQRHPLAALMHHNNNSNNNTSAVHNDDDEESLSPTRPVQKRMFPSEDYSLYSMHESHSQSPTTCSSTTTSTTSTSTTTTTMEAMDDDEAEFDDDEDLLPSADNSPVHFKVTAKEQKPLLLNVQKSFDDAHQDTNSMDSGYGHSSQFRFVQPTGIAPRRLDSGIASPLATSATKQNARSSFSVFSSSSQGSLESMEEDYLDLFQLEDDHANGSFRLATAQQSLSQQKSAGLDLPSNISSLICGAIKSAQQQTPPERRLPSGAPKMRVRRCLLMDGADASNVSSGEEDKENSSPAGEVVVRRVSSVKKTEKKTENTTPKRTNLMMLDANCQQQTKAFKRPEPLQFSPVQSKRYKSEVFGKSLFSGARTADPRLQPFFDEDTLAKCGSVCAQQSITSSAPQLQRAVSMNETMIKNALSRSSSDPDLIGDFTKPFCLPHTEGRHTDLRSISVDTMAELVSGRFDESVASFKVIDCRYPYEFEGGHIRNAKNLYTQEQILEQLVTPIGAGEATLEQESAGKRHILVFHCEFSSERGPKL